MTLRRILLFNQTPGLTFPKEYAKALGIWKGDYVEVYLRNSKTIVIKKHGVKPQKITVND